MKSFTIAAAAASILFGVCMFVSGCGASATNQPKMETSGAMMSSDTKMSGNMTSDGMMSSKDKMSGPTMSGPAMNGMADGKMEKSDASDK
jgi:hypothetical protein